MKKKIVALILALVMIFALAACGKTNTDAPASDNPVSNSSEPGSVETDNGGSDIDVERKIVVGISADPSSFAPWEGFNLGVRSIFPMLYQALISDVRDPDTGKIVTYYTMITGFDKTDDTHYVLHVRDGIYDTAGNPFTAEDVVFCIEQFKAGPSGATLANIVEYEATDELTVAITVADALGIGEFEEMLTTPNMTTKAAFEASPDGFQTTPVGTTGYVLSEYVPGAYAILTRSDLPYWNEAANETKAVEDGYLPTSDTTQVDTVEFRIITDTSTMAIALETGEIDVATAVSTEDVKRFSDGGALADDFNVFQLPDNMYGLIFNCSEQSVMSNVNLRKAVAYSVSAQDLLDMIYDGDGFILHAFAMDYQVGYVSAWDDEDYFSQDLDKAQDYLNKYFEETGTKASDLSLKIYTVSSDAMSKFAQVVQAALIKLTGNDKVCSIDQFDSASYGTMRGSNYLDQWDMAVLNTLSNKTYICYNWQINLDGYIRTSHNDMCFTGDSHLWDLVVTANSPETFNDENVNAVQQYLNENCYFVNYICGPSYWAGADFITSYAVGPKNSIAVCAMTYDWSAKG